MRIYRRRVSWVGYFILSLVCIMLLFSIPIFNWSMGMIPLTLGGTFFFQLLSVESFSERRRLSRRNHEDIY